MTRTIRDETGEKPGVRLPGVTAIAKSEKALKCVIGGEHVWVPDSQIHNASEVYQKGDVGDLVVTQWWAEQRGYRDGDGPDMEEGAPVAADDFARKFQDRLKR